MSRRCDCQAVLDTMMRDPRLRGLPLAARALWLELIQAIRSTGGSVLRFGCVVPDAREIALLVAATESEVEAGLAAIVARGLLVMEADGALSSPLLAAAVSRSEINRINGAKGGDRRRQQALERRQRELPAMGLPSPRPPDPGPESKPEANAAPPGKELAKLKLEEPKAKLAVDDAVFHSAGRAAVLAAGFDPATWTGNYGIVRQWLADGADEAMIVAVLTAKTSASVRHLGYFTKAIAEAIAESGAAVAAELPACSRAYTEASLEWLRAGCRGVQPMPEHFQPGGCHAVAA